MMPETVERQRAVCAANNLISRNIIAAFPDLIAVPAPGNEADCCFQDNELGGALTCTADEGNLLAWIAHASQAQRVLEIGSYVGWSAAHLLDAEGVTITCVDPFIEGPGYLNPHGDNRIHNRFVENIRRLGKEDRVTLSRERSPDVLSELAPEGGWDIAFVDGWHHDNQPLRDVRGVLPHLAPAGVIILHDLYLPDVFKAARFLVAEGFSMHTFPTANMLTLFWRTYPKWATQILKRKH